MDISSKLDFMDKREFTSSESRYYMGIPGDGLNISLDFRTKMSNKKQNSRFAITEITNQEFSKLITKFKK